MAAGVLMRSLLVLRRVVRRVVRAVQVSARYGTAGRRDGPVQPVDELLQQRGQLPALGLGPVVERGDGPLAADRAGVGECSRPGPAEADEARPPVQRIGLPFDVPGPLQGRHLPAGDRDVDPDRGGQGAAALRAELLQRHEHRPAEGGQVAVEVGGHPVPEVLGGAGQPGHAGGQPLGGLRGEVHVRPSCSPSVKGFPCMQTATMVYSLVAVCNSTAP
jgi:hypothetical protein